MSSRFRRPRNLLRPLVVSLFCLLCGGPVLGQVETVRVSRWGTAEGLSHGTVWDFVRDSKGFLWIATSNGLNRFDGRRFRVFNSHENRGGFGSNLIKTLAIDDEDQLWVGSPAGLHRFDPSSGKAEYVSLNPGVDETDGSPQINRLVLDDRGRLWIAANDGLYCYIIGTKEVRHYRFSEQDDGRVTKPGPFEPEADLDEQRPLERVRAFLQASDGSFWVGTQYGLWRIDASLSQRVRIGSVHAASPLSDQHIRGLAEDASGRIWVATTFGLNRINPSNYEIKAFYAEQLGKDAVADNWFNQVVTDNQGRLWVATRGQGIAIVDSEKGFRRFFRKDERVQGFPDDNVINLHIDRDDLLWIGTYKAGMGKMDLKPQVFRNFQLPVEAGLGRQVTELLEDSRGIWWIGTKFGLVRYNPVTENHTIFNSRTLAGFPNGTISALAESENGNVFFSVFGAGAYHLDLARDRIKAVGSQEDSHFQVFQKDEDGSLWMGGSGKLMNYRKADDRFRVFPLPTNGLTSPQSRILAMVPDREQRLLIGTDGGFCIFDKKTSLFRCFQGGMLDGNGPSHAMVGAVLQDQEGRIWLGTGNGINRFFPETGLFEYYFDQNSFPIGFINGLLEGRPGVLWMSTNAGVYRYQPDVGLTHYSRIDGLQGNEFSRGAAFKGRGGMLMFGGTQGFNAFHDIEQSARSLTPPIQLTSLKVMEVEGLPGERLAPEDGSLLIGPHENHFSFEFTALDFSTSGRVRYIAMLEGFEKSPRPESRRNLVSYSHVPGGRYEFKVWTASGFIRGEGPGLVVPVVVVPPWWERTSLRMAALLGLILLVWGMHRFRIRHESRVLARLKAEADKRTAALVEEHRLLSEDARKAGIAEMTTGVLHNIGNILNSVTISTGQIRRVIEQSKSARLGKVVTLVEKTDKPLTEFITVDPRGKLVPIFLSELERSLREEKQLLTKESESLLHQIQLMDQAVTLEQSYAGRLSREENVDIPDLVDNTIQLLEAGLLKRSIRLEKDYRGQVRCRTVPFQLVHVLTNLLRNASEALNEKRGERIIKVSVAYQGDQVVIRVTDNGVGIDPENLNRLFTYGFTTKSDGHGFGLYSCRLAMRELGGDIWAESQGKGKGSTFIMQVPKNPVESTSAEVDP